MHSNPELSFHEKETAKRIGKELGSLGVDVNQRVGGFGVVGVYKNGTGPTVLVRSDMDALPVREQTGLSYASHKKVVSDKGKKVSVMHACGHDIHMTVLVGVARLLKRFEKQWSGTVVFIGQPAEERGAGSRAMLADGLFERFPVPDYALALHVSGSLPAGQVALMSGFMMANVNSVDIIVRGVGGHGAYPQMTKDPVVLAAQIVLALQTIVSREIAATDPAVVTVGSIHGGTKRNVIPDQVKLELTVRSYSDETRNKLLSSIRRIAEGTARAYGVPEDRLPILDFKKNFTPATYNDPALVKRLKGLFPSVIGAENVHGARPTMGGEDFARYGRTKENIPITMFRLGAVDPELFAKSKAGEASLPSLHSPFFAPPPERTIKTGVKTMTSAVLNLLRPQNFDPK